MANIELAEGVGFEPTMDSAPMPVFKTGAFNHSATLPCSLNGEWLARLQAPLGLLGAVVLRLL
jgi:hypothetical protein